MVSKKMSAIKGSDTKPEQTLRAALRAKGLTGYRVNYKPIPGKPDICFVGRKVAIFVNGCFWHRCPQCNYPDPKHNQAYWLAKFNRTKERDKRILQELEELGWKTIVIWECEMKKDLPGIIEKIAAESTKTTK